MVRGGTPATAVAITRTSGLMPALSPASRLATISAAAPSLMPEALPAVVTPSANRALSFCRVSMVVSGRGCSSSLTTRSGLPRPCAIDTGRISLLKKPSLAASEYFCCEPSANLSQSSRLSWKSRARLSAVCGMVSAPNRLSILGLGKRAPSEESNTLKSLPKACSALPTTNGARVMLSTPPATHTSASPQVMAWLARGQRVEARAAQPVVHGAWGLDRQPRQQQRVARHVAAVLAGLGGAADRHVVDHLRCEARARHHLLDDAGQEIVGAHARQRARVASEWRAQSIVDVGFEHGPRLPFNSIPGHQFAALADAGFSVACQRVCTPWDRARRGSARP